MAILDDATRGEVAKRLAGLENPVSLVLFKEAITCDTCEDEETLLRELAELSPRLALKVYNRLAEPEQALLYGVEASPTLIIEGKSGARVRFMGLPAGYEFASLLGAINDAGRGSAEVSADTRQALRGVEARVNIQVFVTPTCPHCPGAVRNAHKLALEFPNIRAEAVEANEFPELSSRYGVQGVPMTIINGKVGFVGAAPESVLAGAILKATETPA